MGFTFHTDITAEELDAFTESSDQNNLFQCAKWAEVKNNWDHIFTGVRKDGILVATALVLIRRLPLGKTLMYIPRGPIMDYHDEKTAAFFLGSLAKLGRKRHAIAVRFDPNVYSRVYAYREKDAEHPRQNEEVVAMLERLGAKHKGYTEGIHESTQPRYNAASHFPDNYYSLLDKKTRQSVQTAIRKGAKLYEGHEFIHEFAEAMKETEQRKGVALRNEDYFVNMMNVYGDHCIVMIAKLHFKEQIENLKKEIRELEARLETETSGKLQKEAAQKLKNDQKDLEILEEYRKKEGKDEVVLAGKLAIYNKNRMEYVYMGNNASYLRIRASYLLYKAFFDRCVELNIHYVSMGGIDGSLNDGLTQFKSNWLMEVEEYIGEFNMILNPFLYHAFETMYPKLISVVSKLRKH